MRFFPLQHTLAATRCPGQPATGRSRFDVCVFRARASAGPHEGARPCGFSLGKVDAMVLAVADACEKSVPAESVVCAWLGHGDG
jgi:hypothetical protein